MSTALPPQADHPGPRSERKGALAAAGSVAAAVASSACCWLPLLLLSFGASAAGATAFFERWRPHFAVAAFALLGLGFYLAYFRKSVCKDGCCDARALRRLRFTRATLWVSAVIVIAFVSFPKYVGALLEAVGGAPATVHAEPTAQGSRTVVFAVEGMHCEACAVTLQSDLTRIDGVEFADVDYATRTARVQSGDADLVASVQEAARRRGYTATLVKDQAPTSSSEGHAP